MMTTSDLTFEMYRFGAMRRRPGCRGIPINAACRARTTTSLDSLEYSLKSVRKSLRLALKAKSWQDIRYYRSCLDDIQTQIAHLRQKAWAASQR